MFPNAACYESFGILALAGLNPSCEAGSIELAVTSVFDLSTNFLVY